MQMKNKINESLKQAETFLLTSECPLTAGFGIKRCSTYHDVERYPDMCLPATYNATHALILLGTYQNISNEHRDSLCEYFNSFQKADGCYRFHQMRDDEIWKGHSVEYSWSYIDNHITNYTMGAIRALGGKCHYPLHFVHEYKDRENLKRWLSQREMSDPWLEGNNIVNLVSFLIYELEQSEPELLKELMDELFMWHDKNQDPQTGFWGTNLTHDPASQMEGMAGAAHNFHLYFYFNREIPYYEKIVDYCLTFLKKGVQSACLDVDVVDILANMIPYGYRVDEILVSLESFAQKLIQFQNDDGGFADEKSTGVRRMDGWVRGYFEPQGLSNCFATWFRCATLAMIQCALHSEESSRFTFRNTIGIGYYNKNYLRGEK